MFSVVLVFVVGYFLISLETYIKINKAAIAILTGILCWTLYVISTASFQESDFIHHVAELSSILFFLMAAMTIVELIDAHDGFEIVSKIIQHTSKKITLVNIALVSFLLSTLLDNLTTTIVMVSVMNRIFTVKNDRLYVSAIIILSANAGGVWSPLGDVTTTMLWIGQKVNTIDLIYQLILPSLISVLIPLIYIIGKFKGVIEISVSKRKKSNFPVWEQKLILFSGIGVLIFVPVFKQLTHLPPFMGMMGGLSVLWVLTEIINYGKNEIDKDTRSVLHALRKIDMPSILFFLGILLAVAALQTSGSFKSLTDYLSNDNIDIELAMYMVGIISAVIDNVPMVSALLNILDPVLFPSGNDIWLLLAYTAGTGGSLLIIGSAAGIAAMGIEQISFLWYVRRITLPALVGYTTGFLFFLFQKILF